MSTARETFLKEILAMDPEFATAISPDVQVGHGNTFRRRIIWNEGNLREALGIPEIPPAPILFTIDVPNPLGPAAPFASMRAAVTAEALASVAAMKVENSIISSIAARCLALEQEIERLRRQGITNDINPSILFVTKEVARAREKYPESDLQSRIDGFTQETGEALQALVKHKHNPTPESLQHARMEVSQAGGQALRLLEEAL